MLGIVVVTYNIPINVLLIQIQAIKKFSLDPYELILVDNSDNPEAIENIRYHTSIQPDIRYFKVDSIPSRGSDSHAFAANLAYSLVREEYEYLFYLDHDCLPIKGFSVKEILEDKLLGGIGQEKGKKYFWPGCFMFNNAKVDKNLVNFSPNLEFGLDTGGNLYRLLEAYGPDSTVFFNEEYKQNTQFTENQYNYYALIYNRTFMHFVNGSNWASASNNESRLNTLLAEYHKLTGV